MRTGHTVGYGGRKERFNGPEHGYGEGRGEEQIDVLHRELESVHLGQVGRHAAESVADGGNTERGVVDFKQIHGSRDDYDCKQRAGQSF